MQILMASTSRTLSKLFCAVAILLFCLTGLLSGCRTHGIPNELMDSFEDRLKEEYPYVKRIELSSPEPGAVYWICRLSVEKSKEAIAELIAELKAFALDDATFDALEETGDINPKSGIQYLSIWIIYGEDNSPRIYEAYTNYYFYSFEWQE